MANEPSSNEPSSSDHTLLQHGAWPIPSPDGVPRRVAAFDMDWTVTRTRSGKTFPLDADDWALWNDHVAPTMQRLHSEGYFIVLCSNQAGVTTGNNTTREAVLAKFAAVETALGVPVCAFGATAHDRFRKPRTGMWDALEAVVPIDREASFYVGDAAGRPRDGTRKPKPDFSDVDYKFAHNLGLRFMVPEQCFAGAPAQEWAAPAFDPRALPGPDDATEEEPTLPSDEVALWLCVGSPAAGKSTYCRTYAPDLACVNQDTLGTRAKCLREVERHLAAGTACVVDGTHRDVATRAHYVQAAKKAGVPCHCLWFDVSKALAFHCNEYRGLTGGRRLPDVVIHTYFKRFEAPTTAEGMTVRVVPFVVRDEGIRRGWLR